MEKKTREINVERIFVLLHIASKAVLALILVTFTFVTFVLACEKSDILAIVVLIIMSLIMAFGCMRVISDYKAEKIRQWRKNIQNKKADG